MFLKDFKFFPPLPSEDDSEIIPIKNTESLRDQLSYIWMTLRETLRILILKR